MEKELLKEIAESPMVMGVISTTTAATGAGTWLDIIPSDIGKLGTLVGIIGVIILGYIRLREDWRKDREDRRKQETHNLDMDDRKKNLTK